jgi:hypothetical protein
MTFENLPAAGAATRGWKYDIGEIRADLPDHAMIPAIFLLRPVSLFKSIQSASVI